MSNVLLFFSSESTVFSIVFSISFLMVLQQFQNVEVSVFSCQVERSVVLVVFNININAFDLQQEFYHFVVAITGSMVKRCPVPLIFVVGAGIVLE